MMLRAPRASRTDALFPYATLVRALGRVGRVDGRAGDLAEGIPARRPGLAEWGIAVEDVRAEAHPAGRLAAAPDHGVTAVQQVARADQRAAGPAAGGVGEAHGAPGKLSVGEGVAVFMRDARGGPALGLAEGQCVRVG